MEIVMQESSDSLVRLGLVGSLDVSGVNEINLKFTANTVGRGKPTIIDLSQTSFIASLGMGMLVTCFKSLRTKGAKLVLLNPQKLVEQTLAVSKLDSLIPIAHSEDEALRLVTAA